MNCPHCHRELGDAPYLDTADYSGCPLKIQCAPNRGVQPPDAWPTVDGDDDGNVPVAPTLETT